MKEFDKWFINRDDFSCAAKSEIEEERESSELSWRAALEWALKSGYIDDYGDDIINSWDIEEELKGERNE